jgi:hypothetical protein
MGFRGRGYDVGGGQERRVKNVGVLLLVLVGEGERGTG